MQILDNGRIIRFRITQILIERYTLRFLMTADIKGKDIQCPICRCEYSVGENMRRLPCLHIFHQECIDTWLSENLSCGLCRTPLTSELQISEEDIISEIPSTIFNHELDNINIRIDVLNQNRQNQHESVEADSQQEGNNDQAQNENRAPKNEYHSPENQHHPPENEHHPSKNEYHSLTNEHHLSENEHPSPENEHPQENELHSQENEHHSPENEHQHGNFGEQQPAENEQNWVQATELNQSTKTGQSTSANQQNAGSLSYEHRHRKNLAPHYNVRHPLNVNTLQGTSQIDIIIVHASDSETDESDIDIIFSSKKFKRG